jgi:hypothetical protein
MKSSADDVVSFEAVEIVNLNSEETEAQRGSESSSDNKQPDRANKTKGNDQTEQGGLVNKTKKNQRKLMSPLTIIDEVKSRLNFCNVFGMRGFVLLLLIIGISVFQWAVLVGYTRTTFNLFTNIERPFVWVFLVMAIIFTLLSLWIFIRWKYIALAIVTLHHDSRIKKKKKIPIVL